MSRLPRRFWFLTALAALVIALFCRLALWQYHRAHERAALAAAVHAAMVSSATRLAPEAARDLPRFAHVYAEGRYDDARQVLLTEMPQPDGDATGVEVLTPLRLGPRALLLVNRGWVAADAQGRTPAALAAPAGRVRVAGYLAELPRPGLRLGGGARLSPGRWPQRLLYPRWRALDRLYGAGLVHRVLLLSAQAPGGYDRAWRFAPVHGPQENYGYMAQWLGLAATVFVVWLVLTLRSRRRRTGA